MNTSANNPHFAAFQTSLLKNKNNAVKWFENQFIRFPAPLYASIDMRISPYKCSAVDANFFPAGFNNISKSAASDISDAFKLKIGESKSAPSTIFILAEDFDRNQRYHEHISSLKRLLINSGFQVSVGVIDSQVRAFSNFQIVSENNSNFLQNEAGEKADFVINNCDFSAGIPAALHAISTPIEPSPFLGWWNRRKSNHFQILDSVTNEFCKNLNIGDPWFLNALFRNCKEVDYITRDGMKCIMRYTGELLVYINQYYDQYKIDYKPYTVVKPDAGTFGRGIHLVRNPAEIETLNRKQRTKLSAVKQAKNRKVIIQEGVPSSQKNSSGATSESVFYFIGEKLVGSFQRYSDQLSEEANLNQPGSNFSTDVSNNDIDTNPFYYVQKIGAQLSLLAMAKEQAALL